MPIPRKFLLFRMLTMVAILVAMAVGFGACSDDDGPGQNATTDPVTLNAAVNQTPEVVASIVQDVLAMDDVAGGLGAKDFAYDFDWIEDGDYWQAVFSGDEAGVAIAMTFTVQYRDEGGNPVLAPENAASFTYTKVGTLDVAYADTARGVALTSHYVIDEEVVAGGLGGEALTLDGHATAGWAFDYVSEGYNESLDTTLGWEVLGDGVMFPAAGCPEGTIRVTMAPFHCDIVFDGSDQAAYTLYDAQGNVVADGSGVAPLDCAVPVNAP
jgi:hypothetical protein